MQPRRCPECENTFTDHDSTAGSTFCPFCGFPITNDPGILQQESDHIEYLIEQARTWVDQGIVFPIVADTLEDIYRTRQDGIRKVLDAVPAPPEEPPASTVPERAVQHAETSAGEDNAARRIPAAEAGKGTSPETVESGLLNEIRNLVLRLRNAELEDLTRWGIWLSAGLIILALVLLLGKTVLGDAHLKVLGLLSLSLLLAGLGWGLVSRNLKTVGAFFLLLGNTGGMIAASQVILPLKIPAWQSGLMLGLLGLLLFVFTAVIVRMAIFTGLGAAGFVVCGFTPFLLNTAAGGDWWPFALAVYSLSLVAVHLAAGFFFGGKQPLIMPLSAVGQGGCWLVLLTLVQQPFGSSVVLMLSWMVLGSAFMLLGKGASGTYHSLAGIFSFGCALSSLLSYWIPEIPYGFISLFAGGLMVAVCGLVLPFFPRTAGGNFLQAGGTLLILLSLLWAGFVFAYAGWKSLFWISVLLFGAGGYFRVLRRCEPALFSDRESTVIAWVLLSAAGICLLEVCPGIGSYTRVTLYILFAAGSLLHSTRKKAVSAPGARLASVVVMLYAVYTTIGLQAGWLTPVTGSVAILCFISAAAVSGTPWLVFATLIPIVMTAYGTLSPLGSPWLICALTMVAAGWLYRAGAQAARSARSPLVEPLRLTGAVLIWLAWGALGCHLLSGDYWSSSLVHGLLLPSLVLLLSSGFWAIWRKHGRYFRRWYLAGAGLAGILCLLLAYLGVNYWIFYSLPWSLLLFGIAYNDSRLAAKEDGVVRSVAAGWKMRIASLLVLGPPFLQALIVHDPFPGAIQVVMVASIFLLAGLFIRSRIMFSSGLFFLGLEGLVLLVLIVPFHRLGLGEMLFLSGLIGLLTTLLLKTGTRRFLSKRLTIFRRRFNRLIGDLH